MTNTRNNELFDACQDHDLNRVKAALAAGADVNARDAQGQTPLHFSAMQGKTETVKVLLDHRADPTIADAFDRTSESMAAEHGSLAMVSAMATARREQHAEQAQQRSALGKTMDRLKSMGLSR